ncbi:glycosyltransferase family 4 protein [Streptomyces scabiei]|uniref:glycosyltransferase family 4 protein n=1 Tax=Streptomyces scabiei TaxID=1930 RepID=UPI0038F78A72
MTTRTTRPQGRSSRLRVLVIVPSYGPRLPTGAAITTREYVHALTAAGHRVDVVTTVKTPAGARVEDGVRVWPLRLWRHAVQAAAPDLLVTHHGDRKAARIVAQTPGVRHLLLVHGMADDRDLGRPDLTWFPSHACRAHYTAHTGPTVVIPPPVDPARYRTDPGPRVTLNGSTTAKGADVLAEVAARMPETRFLVVESAGAHERPAFPANVDVIGRTDPRQVYAATRLLLMPSARESYGRVGVEAMASGIPVLAAPLPGIREALGSAAVYVERDDVSRWVAEVRRLEDPEAYAVASARARAHALRLDPARSLAAFVDACQETARPQGPRPAPAPALEPVTPARSAVRSVSSAPRVVAWVHYGVPYRRAGSETMLHTMMRALQAEGLDVLLLCSEMPEAPARWTVDGVPYMRMETAAAKAAIRRWRPPVLVTHHHFGERAVLLAKETGSRSVLVLHNDHDQPALTAGPDLCVYNTEWIRKSLATRYPVVDQAGFLTVHPPVIPDEHRAPQSGRHVTLVNLNRHKGVDTWRAAARLLPGLPFLGVTGAHGRQVLRPRLPNTRIIGQTSNMRRDVWAHTRVLLVPSSYESFGMAAVEALASGIPVIAHPTPGLREALGEGAVFLDRTDTRAWAATIRELYQAAPRRARMSTAALERSAFLERQGRTELQEWVDTIRDLAAHG